MKLVDLPYHLRAWVNDPVEAGFLISEIFDEHIYLSGPIELDHQSIVLDVGANVGLASIFFARVCGVAAVYAIEPVPASCEALAANFVLHGIRGHVYCQALSDHRGHGWFGHYPHASAKSGFYADSMADRRMTEEFLREEGFGAEDISWIGDRKFTIDPIRVQCTTLLEFLADAHLDRVDLLKLDVEKSEIDVLVGVGQDCWRRGIIRQVVAEVHDVDGGLPQISALFRSHGYRVDVAEHSAHSGLHSRIVTAVL